MRTGAAALAVAFVAAGCVNLDSTGPCSTDADCEGGGRCDATGGCVAPPVSCDCAPGEECLDGECRCPEPSCTDELGRKHCRTIPLACRPQESCPCDAPDYCTGEELCTRGSESVCPQGAECGIVYDPVSRIDVPCGRNQGACTGAATCDAELRCGCSPGVCGEGCPACAAGECLPSTGSCCGDGIVGVGEECDPGVAGSPCSAACTLERAVAFVGNNAIHVVCPGGGTWGWGESGWCQVGSAEPTTDDCPQHELHDAGSPAGNANCHAVEIDAGLPSSLRLVDGGALHALGIGRDGGLYGWGSNYNHRLTEGIFDPVTTGFPHIDWPQRIGSSNDWALASAGANHSAAIRTDGTLWAWGGNQLDRGPPLLGQAAGGTLESVLQPARVVPAAAPDVRFLAVSAGVYDHGTAAVAEGGTVYFFGSLNAAGAADRGEPAEPPVLEPTAVAGLPPVVGVSVGLGFVLALTADGEVFSWGADIHGKLGRGRDVAGSCGTFMSDPVPARIASPPGVRFGAISAGYDGAAAIDTGGHLWTWGRNDELPTLLGRPVPGGEPCDSTPRQLGSGADWSSVGVAQLVSAAVKADGSVWTWGAYRSLANNIDDPVAEPVEAFRCP